jgi:peptidoglycan hydrolase-like protein with peptidoglycan-binding domain
MFYQKLKYLVQSGRKMLVQLSVRHTKLIVACIAITTFISGCSGSDNNADTAGNPEPVDKPSASVARQNMDPGKEALGQKVIAFEHRLYDIERQAIGISKKAGDEILASVKGRPDFAILREAERTYLQIADDYKKLPIPEGLSPEDSTVLKTAKEDYAAAFEAKAKALEAVMLYAVNKQDSAAYKAADETNLGEKLIHKAVASVIALQLKLGVDFTQKKDDPIDDSTGQSQIAAKGKEQAQTQAPVETSAPVQAKNETPPSPPKAQNANASATPGAPLPETVLKKGAKGDAVKALQEALIQVGESLPAGGADGVFGDGTAEALKSFQRKNGLSADGVYGAATQRVLQSKLGSVLSITNGHIAIKGVHRGMKEDEVTRLFGKPRSIERDGYYNASFEYSLLSVGFYDKTAEGVTYLADPSILQDPFLTNFPGEKYAGKDGKIAVYYLPQSKEQLFFKEDGGALRTYIKQDDDNFKFQINKGTYRKVE